MRVGGAGSLRQEGRPSIRPSGAPRRLPALGGGGVGSLQLLWEALVCVPFRSPGQAQHDTDLTVCRFKESALTVPYAESALSCYLPSGRGSLVKLAC